MADAPDCVYEADISAGSRLLLTLLWRYAKHGEVLPYVYPSVGTLSEKLGGQDPSSTRRQLSQLRRAGLITEQRRRVESGLVVRGWVLHHESVRVRHVRQRADVHENQASAHGEQARTHGDRASAHGFESVGRASVPARPRIRARPTAHPCTPDRASVHTEAPVKPHEAPTEARGGSGGSGGRNGSPPNASQREREGASQARGTPAAPTDTARTENAAQGLFGAARAPDRHMTLADVLAGAAEGAEPMSARLMSAGRVTWERLIDLRGDRWTEYERRVRTPYENAVRGGQSPRRIAEAVERLQPYWLGKKPGERKPRLFTTWEALLKCPPDVEGDEPTGPPPAPNREDYPDDAAYREAHFAWQKARHEYNRRIP